jgi:hypothetical protein
MSEGRMFIDSLSTAEREPSDPYRKMASELERLFGDIVSDASQLAELYEPMRTNQWDDEFVPANLFKIAPTLIEHLLEVGEEVDLHDCLQTDSLIYIISPIGRGKTTYIHHKLRVDLPNRLSKLGLRLIPVIFDVRTCASPSDFVPLFAKRLDEEIDKAFPFFSVATDANADTVAHKALCEAFAEQLRKAGYDAEYQPKDKDPEMHRNQREEIARLRREDLIEFSKIRLNYARAKDPHAFVVLVVDNMDQHLMFQHGEEIIRDSHALGFRLQCPLILTLRDASFRKNNPAFLSSSYSPRYLALSTGLAQPMLSRRLRRAPHLVSREDPLVGRFIGAIACQLGVSGKERVNRISKLVEDWIDPISNRDRRAMLDVMRSVISSLHLTSQTFERNRPSKNDYVNTDFEIAVAKVKMAILLGRYPYYSDESYRTPVLNLFCENRAHRICSSLIRLKILQYLFGLREEGVIVSDVIEKCTSILGASAGTMIQMTITRLLEKGLAVALSESDDFQTALMRIPIELDKLMDRRLYVTFNGMFHHNVLLKDDIYLDETKYATPLPIEIYEEVFRHYGTEWAKNRDLRQESTLAFIKYLISCETDETTTKLSDALNIPRLMRGSYEAYQDVIRAMDEHEMRTLEVRRH